MDMKAQQADVLNQQNESIKKYVSVLCIGIVVHTYKIVIWEKFASKNFCWCCGARKIKHMKYFAIE